MSTLNINERFLPLQLLFSSLLRHKSTFMTCLSRRSRFRHAFSSSLHRTPFYRSRWTCFWMFSLYSLISPFFPKVFASTFTRLFFKVNDVNNAYCSLYKDLVGVQDGFMNGYGVLLYFLSLEPKFLSLENTVEASFVGIFF